MDEEPIMCSKCNITFENESEYHRHYNEKHKPVAGTNQINKM
jgi:uncharacterized C2H2 Zn-finger protein